MIEPITTTPSGKTPPKGTKNIPTINKMEAILEKSLALITDIPKSISPDSSSRMLLATKPNPNQKKKETREPQERAKGRGPGRGAILGSFTKQPHILQWNGSMRPV